MHPLVSVIIPLYNAEKYIGETIDSVISQSYPNWELIIVDDHSSDSSYLIAEKYSQQDSRIRLYKRTTENRGGSVCRNIGINNSKGEYIIFLDADDLLLSHCLENRVSVIHANLKLDFAVFQMKIFSDNDFSSDVFITHRYDNYLYAFLALKNLPWQTSCPIWRASFFKQHVKGFNEDFPRLQDPELHTRALLIENVRFEVYDDKSHLDCLYRVDHKKVNLTNVLLGANLFIDFFYDKIIKRNDSQLCINSLYILYGEVMRIYTSCSEQDMKLNLLWMKKMNYKCYCNKIINFRIYIKTLTFSIYINRELYKYRKIDDFLSVLKVKRFYSYIISSKENV